MANDTCILVSCLAKIDHIGKKWVYRTKVKGDGLLDKYKAWVVTQGYDQVEGIDYIETFSPIVKP